MPGFKGTGLPPDHPFAGTRIVFIDALVKRRVQGQRAREHDNPMAQTERDTEDFLRTKCSHPANDGEGQP